MSTKKCLPLGLTGKCVVEKLERISTLINNTLCYITIILKHGMWLLFLTMSRLFLEFKYEKICLIDKQFIFKRSICTESMLIKYPNNIYCFNNGFNPQKVFITHLSETVVNQLIAIKIFIYKINVTFGNLEYCLQCSLRVWKL